MSKDLAWGGLLVGSTVGNAVPWLWGGSMFSWAGAFFALVGGALGLYAAVRVSRI